MKKNKEGKNFFLYVPAIIDNDRNLSTTDRYLLFRMINLDNENGCHAYNSYLACLLNCSLTTISRTIKHLEELGYVICNKPNKNRGGRGHIRHVREDLKYKRSDDSIKESTPPKKTCVASQNVSHIYRKKKNDKKNEKISTKLENKLAQRELNIPIPEKAKFYNSCKNEYNKRYMIVWDKGQIESLIELINKLYQTFKSKIDLKNDELSKCLLQIFIQAIIYKPNFFTDSLPQTFVRFWNKAIQQPKFEKAINRIRMSNAESEGF